MKYDVFISHSSKDHELAMKICGYLEKDRKIKCWIAPRNVIGGVSYARCIFDSIDESQVVLIVLSEHSNKSKHVESEIDRAFIQGKIIVPFKVDASELSPILGYYIGSKHYINGCPTPQKKFKELKDSVIKSLPELSIEQAVTDAKQLLATRYGLTIDQVESFLNPHLSNEIGVKGDYSILQNSSGEIMLMMDSRLGGPDNPRFIYDGSDTALLYRSEDSSVAFRDIDPEARTPLKMVSEILVVEIANEEVVREYIVPVRLVLDIRQLINF